MAGPAILLCKTCGKERAISAFSPHKGCKLGVDTSRCKPCKKSKVDWKKQPLEKRIYNRVKSRAKRLGREFDLELEDIQIPVLCPVFQKPFIYGDSDWTYSLDRLDNDKGYVKGNVIVVSNKANRIKNNATKEELEAVLKFFF